jgi:hypothetical protein
MESAKRKSRSNTYSPKKAEQKGAKSHFAICIRNEGYPASLELRKVYRLLPDHSADKGGLVRVIDESGEDYLYPREYFVPVKLPQAVERVFSRV